MSAADEWKTLTRGQTSGLTGRECLLRWRELNSLTQPEAGEVLGVLDTQICRWEKGRVRPNIDTCIALQTACGIPVTAWQKES